MCVWQVFDAPRVQRYRHAVADIQWLICSACVRVAGVRRAARRRAKVGLEAGGGGGGGLVWEQPGLALDVAGMRGVADRV